MFECILDSAAQDMPVVDEVQFVLEGGRWRLYLLSKSENASPDPEPLSTPADHAGATELLFHTAARIIGTQQLIEGQKPPEGPLRRERD